MQNRPDPVFTYWPSVINAILTQLFLIGILILLLLNLSRDTAYFIVFICYDLLLIWRNSSIEGIELTSTHLDLCSRKLLGKKKVKRSIPIHQIQDCYIQEFNIQPTYFCLLFFSYRHYGHLLRPIIVFKFSDGSSHYAEVASTRKKSDELVRQTQHAIQFH